MMNETECELQLTETEDLWPLAWDRIKMIRGEISEKYKAKVQRKFGLYSKDGVLCLPKATSVGSAPHSIEEVWRAR